MPVYHKVLFERKSLILDSKTKAWIVAGCGIVFSLSLIFWQLRVGHAAAINLTTEDMSLIASDQAPQTRTRLASDPSARKDFAKNVRELLAVAEEARSKSIAYRPEIKRQLDLVRAIVISQNYNQSRAGGRGTASDVEIEAVFKVAGQEEFLGRVLKAV